MNRSRVLATVVVAALLGGVGFGAYWWGMNRGMQMSAPPIDAAPAVGSLETRAADATTGRKVLYWHDPMVPGPRFDKPGKSPFMNMMLVPVYADEGTDEGKVTISPRIQQNLGIRTAEVVRGSMTPALEAVGTTAYNERDVAVVQARASGFLEKLLVRAPLDAVRRGQPLAELYVPDWVAAQEEFLAVNRMNGKGVDALVAGARQRMRLAGMTDAQIRQVEERGEVQPRLTVTAPAGGVVTELGAREGMTVATGSTLFRINGLSTVWINAEVPEAAAAQVRPGQAVEVRSPALPGTVLRGRVSAILPDVNPVTRTLKARVEVDNPGARLLPGVFAMVSLTPAPRGEALMIPSEAVIRTGKRTVVFVAQGDGKFAPVPVETGMEASGMTEIRKGLEAGQKVVVSGQFLLDSEASLKGTTTRMGEGQSLDSTKSASAIHRGEGRVEAVDKDLVTLSHGPMPSLKWGAMTMGFKPPAGGVPAGIAVGDRVTFDIRALPDGLYEITSIAPAPTGGSVGDRSGGVKDAAKGGVDGKSK